MKTERPNFKAMNLKLVSICRQSVLDANYIGVCEHCGRIIVNIATVENVTDGKKYDIGLDCKKTLIDAPKIAQMSDKYEIKDYKQKTNVAQKFLLYISQPERYELTADNSTLYVNDLTLECFPGTNIFGKCIDNESLNYLFNIGLKDFLQNCVNNNLIKYKK